MHKNRVKAVFLDIDGTLITRNGGPYQEDKEAMEEAAEKGHLLFLNTGRSLGNIPQALLDLPFLKGIAAGGGAHILMSGPPNVLPRYQTIYHKWIPEDALEKIIARYVKQSSYCALEGERDCYIINQSSFIRTAKASISVNSPEDFKRKSSGDLVTKLTLEGFISDDEYRFLEPFFTVNRFADYTEAILKNENKGNAAELILNTVGIKREDSFAIGDSANDIDMFRFAGLGIAMGNASDEIKATAGAITGNCGEGGVAAALRKFVLAEESRQSNLEAEQKKSRNAAN